MGEKLQKLLENKNTPQWSGLLEEVLGQIANYMNRFGDYSLAEEYHPNLKQFSTSDFVIARSVEDIPEDWLKYVYACMEKIGL